MSDAPPRVAVLHGGDAPAWTPDAATTITTGSADAWVDGAGDADVALLDAESIDAIAVARRLHARLPSLQLLIVVPESARAALERGLTFAPGIGEVWLQRPESVDGELLERAAAVTRQRRRYETTRLQLESLPSLPRSRRSAPHISDAYLAALLQVLPDAIVSIDDADRLLSWSPAAKEILRIPDAGPPAALASLVRPADPGAFRSLLERGRNGTVRGAMEWRSADDGVRTADLTVTPLEVAGHSVRAVVLHDTTEQQLAQQRLEEQAAELETQTEQLAAQRDELARLSTARSRFYASMSHEIRTPINAILGYNDLLLAGVYGDLSGEQAGGLDRAQAAARHLRELVNDVLDLSKIESGKLVVVAEEFVLDDLVGDVLDTIAPVATESGVELRAQLDAGVTVRSDPRRVRQILLNLVSNAVKYGDQRPVNVRTRTGDTHICVDVEDQGMGIEAEQLDRIFEEFVQINSSAEGGTGLGLAISRKLATALGGSIEARSQHGTGSTFTLLLPRRTPASPE